MTDRYQLCFVAVLLVSTTACATGGARGAVARAAEVPAWATAADGATPGATQDLSRWWEQLADPELTSLIERALVANPDVRVAQARLREARAQRLLTTADLLPAVTASASASDHFERAPIASDRRACGDCKKLAGSRSHSESALMADIWAARITQRSQLQKGAVFGIAG